ncbi:unnamed protein product [Cladocopium goreaui]|uniref:Histone-lysine N-methyltransferase set5 n=1 Tax=Cladocopium goreaui TaxID=2562237 RepID=A0A9P1FPX9_9DINO|nr:unnamed protein product [Cladocopium goreaui]
MAEGAADNDTWRQEAVQMQKDNPELTTAQIAEKKKGELVKPEKGSGGYSKEARHESPVQSSVKDLPYRIAPIPGKGLGLIATRQISRGELIVEESPVLMERQGFMGFSQIQEQFDQLEASVQDQIMDLHDKNAPDGNGKTLLGGVGSSNGALCLVISRANHSCINNCYHGWVDGRERLFCDADIASGEEICTNYIQWHLTTDQRQRELQTQFGFACDCPACMQAESLQKKHDAIRLKIGQLDQSIPELYPMPSKAVALVEQVLSLYEKLGRPIPYVAEVRHCYDAFQLSLSERNIPAAKRWIQRAYAASLITDGPSSPQALRFERFVKNPLSRLQDGLCI